MKYVPKSPHQLRQAIIFYSASLDACTELANPPAHLVNYLMAKIDNYQSCLTASKAYHSKASGLVFPKN